jgi:hypothetical protein
MAMQDEHIIDIALNGKNYCLSISDSTILLQEHLSGSAGLECSDHK